MRRSNRKDIKATLSEVKEFEVEKLLDKKTEKGKVFYKVKWKDYPLSEATWEPKENLKNAQQVVRTFESSLKKTQKAKRGDSPKFLEDTNIEINEEKDTSTIRTRRQKMLRHLKNDVIKAEKISDFIVKEEDKDLSGSDDTSKVVDINLTNDTPAMKINSIKYVKLLGDVLYAYVSYYEGSSPEEKHKTLTTLELAFLDPLKLIQFYESKIIFRPK